MSTPSFSQSPYTGHADLAALRAFLMRLRARYAPGRAPVDHVGDLVWQSHQNLQVDPTRDVRIWRDAQGAVGAYVLANRPNGIEFQLDDRLWDTPLPDLMLTAALADRAAYVRDDAEPKPITSSTHEADHAKRALLEAHGFVPDGYQLHVLSRDLAASIPDAPLAQCFTLADMSAECLLSERVDAHREVWHPSRFTLDGYRRLRRTPGYDATLDIAALVDDRKVASYGIAWLDEANCIAEFEPVGTRPAYRRRGLGREVLFEGMRRMRGRGMSHALVYSLDNTLEFYASAGFVRQSRYLGYVRPATI